MPAEGSRTRKGRLALATTVAALSTVAGGWLGAGVPGAMAAPAHHHHAPPAYPGPASIGAARHYLSSRAGRTSFAVADTRGKVSGAHVQRTFPSASVVKAMLLVAYLQKLHASHRGLSQSDKAILEPMIHVSD